MGANATFRRLLVATAICQGSFNALAAPDEIQVYTPEMDAPGEFGLELHLNYVPKGRKAPSYDGEMKSDGRLQVTPEFSYGISKTLEAGLYLPVAMSDAGNLYGNGIRFRLKYITPREAEAKVFWGLNLELGYSAHRISESPTGLEIRPIIGYQDRQWLVSFNPIVNLDLSDKTSRQPQFEPALKATHRVIEGVSAGAEYYGEYGRLNKLLPADQLTHYLYGVVDVDFKGFDMNFGIGRGLKNAEDQWVVKAIIAIPFN